MGSRREFWVGLALMVLVTVAGIGAIVALVHKSEGWRAVCEARRCESGRLALPVMVSDSERICACIEVPR